MPKPLEQRPSFPSVDEVLQASDEKIMTWFNRFSAPSNEHETVVMKLIIQRKNKIKHDNTRNQR